MLDNVPCPLKAHSQQGSLACMLDVRLQTPSPLLNVPGVVLHPFGKVAHFFGPFVESFSLEMQCVCTENKQRQMRSMQRVHNRPTQIHVAEH